MASIITGSGVDVDVEAAVTAVLRPILTARFPGVVVASAVPKAAGGTPTFPPLLVVVNRTGGSALSPAHDSPRMTVQCWAAAGPVEAWELCGVTRGVVASMSNERVVLPPVRAGEDDEPVWVSYAGEVGGPVVFDDPRTTNERYQFTVTLSVRR